MSADEHAPKNQQHPFKMGDLVTTNGKAPAGYRGRRGRITETMPSGHECRVEFEDGLLPATGYLMTYWLEH